MPQNSSLRQYFFILLIIISLLISLFHPTKFWDNRLLDFQFKLLRSNNTITLKQDVVLIGIDEQSYQQFKEPFALWHEHLGHTLKALTQAEPAVFGMDLSMPDRSFNPILPGQDQKLLSSMLMFKKTAPLVIGLTVNQDGSTRKIYPPYLSVAGKKGVGYVLWKLGDDRVVRRFTPKIKQSQQQVFTLSGQMSDSLGIQSIPSGLINYAVGTAINYISIQQVIQWYQQGNIQRLQEEFKHKVVLLGSVLPFEDRHYQPVNLAAWETENNNFVPGVLLHIQALRNILNNNFVQEVSWLWILVLNLCLTLLWWFKTNPLKLVLLSLFLTGSLLLSQYYLLPQLIYIPVLSSIAITLIALFGRQLLEMFFMAKERQRLRNAFGGYVSPDVLSDILNGELQPGIHGKKQQVCMLFSDIRNFTGISEKMQPEDIIKFLNIYLEAMTEAIQNNEGTIDKFMGDGIMAFFGAPKILKNPAANAFAAAQDKLKKLQLVNQEFSHKDMPELKIGIGLHLGDAVIGNIGSEKRNEYTAIGDVVNTASRLEGLTKQAGYPIVVSEDVIKALPNTVEFDNLGEMPVKGRSPVPVFGWPAKNKL
ncbi:MAG: adenylate/guanylate cyclase domain-containing protein [gamma proteobacterium symbiont of Taylorina sp.]|nr:adenylate/guanylate cyclase domain-containing protein [gamma proteobacterium symbiont of Taylorina sp.]